MLWLCYRIVWQWGRLRWCHLPCKRPRRLLIGRATHNNKHETRCSQAINAGWFRDSRFFISICTQNAVGVTRLDRLLSEARERPRLSPGATVALTVTQAGVCEGAVRRRRCRRTASVLSLPGLCLPSQQRADLRLSVLVFLGLLSCQ
jgi:hypothetical protein